MYKKIVFFGDSITAANRSSELPLGNGYVFMLSAMFKESSNLADIESINSGINGNMVRDLKLRYHQDVLDHQPNAIVIKIGINDAYNDFISDHAGNQISEYESGLRHLLSSIQRDLPLTKVLLFTPYYISDSREDTLYKTMDAYGGIVKMLGEEQGIPVLDIQEVFDEAVKLKPARQWAEDQIHPFPTGHALIAEAAFSFLKEHLS